MIKKAVSIILTGILCLSMVSCAAPGNNPADSSAADSSEKTAAENGSAEIAAAGSSGEIAAENSSGESVMGGSSAEIASEKEDFDYDKFFRAFADRYACVDTPVMATARLIDEHPMNYLRINATLQQYDEFLDFYGITEGDNMYLAPEDRVVIW